MRRKFDDLPTPDVTSATGKTVAATVADLVARYNATPTWDLLEGTPLNDQLAADQVTLKAINDELMKAFADEPAEQESARREGVIGPILYGASEHEEKRKAMAAELAAAAEAAKPLKQKHVAGLDQPALVQYQQLVGDAAEMADVSEESVKLIVALYKPTSLAARNAKKAWEDEARRRERQKRDLGGANGWVTELLKPHEADENVATALVELGEAKTTAALTQQQMITILNELNTSKVSVPDVTGYFARAVNKGAASEPIESVRGKVSEKQEQARGIKADALSRLGDGTTWKELEQDIDSWWASLKERTQQENTFWPLFKAGRMTVRAIAPDGSAQGGTFKAQVLAGESGTTTGKADMTLERNRASIVKRTDPATWTGDDSDQDVKRKTGLYELSASLLNPDRKEIFPQLKFYSTPEAVVFMPAAYPEDQQIFAAISELVDADKPKLREISSQITRITMAQSTDMATKLVDMSPDNDGSDIRYGESGSVIRHVGGTEQPARSHEIEQRRLDALQYFKIFDDIKKMRNEVVVEYRRHASGVFPLFTSIDHTKKRFYILDSKTFEKTGAYIDNLGVTHPA